MTTTPARMGKAVRSRSVTAPAVPGVASSIREVEALRETWAAAGASRVDSDLDYFLTVVSADPTVIRPWVLTVPLPDAAPGLVVSRLVRQRFDLQVGYRTVPGPRARSLVVSFGGVLGTHGPADAETVIRALDGALRAGHADVVVLQKVDVDSDLYRAAMATGRARTRLARPEVVLHTTELPSSWDELLAARSAKSRRQIRYDDNKVRRVLGERLTLRRLDRPEELHRLPDVEAVAARSYQSGLGVSLADQPVQRALLAAAAEHGWLRVWMAYVDDRPAAFWWGVVRGGDLLVGSPGFDPEFAQFRLGYYVLRRLLEDSCADPEITSIDYGPGDADYKARFGTHASSVRDVLLFSPGARGLMLSAALRGQDATVRTAKSLVQRSGRAAEFKRRARARLIPARTESDGA
ncbi:GNAT family N-acetyltransferase [Nocardioides insulae]|uniref:GNAT family N-acetyltransferase n=1 Tax=Nocardioides insulae TaxID=394734 RepID=UPI001469B3EF|nr:GNAT family N-acetyltransferase [Nocardioides insulae]